MTIILEGGSNVFNKFCGEQAFYKKGRKTMRASVQRQMAEVKVQAKRHAASSPLRDIQLYYNSTEKSFASP